MQSPRGPQPGDVVVLPVLGQVAGPVRPVEVHRQTTPLPGVLLFFVGRIATLENRRKPLQIGDVQGSRPIHRPLVAVVLLIGAHVIWVVIQSGRTP